MRTLQCVWAAAVGWGRWPGDSALAHHQHWFGRDPQAGRVGRGSQPRGGAGALMGVQAREAKGSQEQASCEVGRASSCGWS